MILGTTQIRQVDMKVLRESGRLVAKTQSRNRQRIMRISNFPSATGKLKVTFIHIPGELGQKLILQIFNWLLLQSNCYG